MSRHARDVRARYAHNAHIAGGRGEAAGRRLPYPHSFSCDRRLGFSVVSQTP